jgi:predicted TIM-barrel fold metal-dependent hydrolase
MPDKYRIWDVHCHLSGVPGRTPEERMTALLKNARRHGIERVCVFMGMSTSRNPTPERLRQENDEVLQALSHYHDRAFGFCYVSGEHVEASLNEIDRCVRKGPMVGIKLWVARRCSAASLDAIVRRAAALQAVIYQHTWFKLDGTQFPGESTPADLVELAQRNPKITFLCGHSGGAWELGIRAIRSSKNILAESAGFDPTSGYLEMAVRELGAERIVYGSDAGGRSFASQLAKILGADISEEARKLVLGDNLRRLLRPILRHKGVKE